MKFILVSHGSFSKGLVDSSQMIVGQQKELVAYGLYPEDDISKLKEQLEEELLKSDMENVVFFTDLFHGSPFNAVVSLMKKYDVYHVTGINMPLMLEALMARQNEGIKPEVLCDSLIEASRGTIVDVRRFLQEVK